MITIDSLGPDGKRRMVIATTVVGLVFSIVTFVLRVWVRSSVAGRLYREDWVMAVALLLSFGFAICNFYGEETWRVAQGTCAHDRCRADGGPGRARWHAGQG
jgi:hypothetical protein